MFYCVICKINLLEDNYTCIALKHKYEILFLLRKYKFVLNKML